MSDPTTVPEFIDAMIGVINDKGWGQGDYHNVLTGKVCILGAKHKVWESVTGHDYFGDDPVDFDARRMDELQRVSCKTDRYLHEWFHNHYGVGTINWNDDIAESQEQVVHALNAAKGDFADE